MSETVDSALSVKEQQTTATQQPAEETKSAPEETQQPAPVQTQVQTTDDVKKPETETPKKTLFTLKNGFGLGFAIFLIITIGLFLGGMLAPHIADKEEYDKRQKGVVISLLSFSMLTGVFFIGFKLTGKPEGK
jgi:hypothetical protein